MSFLRPGVLSSFLWNNHSINRYNTKNNIKTLSKTPINNNTYDHISNNVVFDHNIINDTLDAHQNTGQMDDTCPIAIDDIKTLQELNFFTINFKGCSMRLNQNTVVGAGNEKSSLMLIGEAPGEEEDIQSLPFVGASGKLVRLLLKDVGIEPNKTYISNMVNWRPPSNRTPTQEEITQCMPIIKKRIELINPKVVLLVGGTAAKSLLCTMTPISRLRGSFHDLKINNTQYKSFVIFHPSFLLRAPSFKKQTIEDLRLLVEFLKEHNLYDDLAI